MQLLDVLRHIPKTGLPSLIIFLVSFITWGIAEEGSPGPFEKKKPSGFHSHISSNLVFIGNTFK